MLEREVMFKSLFLVLVISLVAFAETLEKRISVPSEEYYCVHLEKLADRVVEGKLLDGASIVNGRTFFFYDNNIVLKYDVPLIGEDGVFFVIVGGEDGKVVASIRAKSGSRLDRVLFLLHHLMHPYNIELYNALQEIM